MIGWMKGSGKPPHLPNKVGSNEIKDLHMLILSCVLVKLRNAEKKKKPADRWKINESLGWGVAVACINERISLLNFYSDSRLYIYM